VIRLYGSDNGPGVALTEFDSGNLPTSGNTLLNQTTSFTATAGQATGQFVGNHHDEPVLNVATVYTHPMAQGGGGNGHYGGNAEVYMDVGGAMGQAMVELLKK